MKISHWLFVSLVIVASLPAVDPQTAPAVEGQRTAQAQKYADEALRLAQQNDLIGAEAKLRHAVELDSNNPQYLGALGGILGMEHKLDESTVYCGKALKLDPDNWAIRRDLASSQWQLGRSKEAKQNLDSILRVRPQDRRTILLLGMVEESLKNHARAAELLESVPDLVKQQPESLCALAGAQYHTGEKERARLTLSQLLSHSSGDRGLFLSAKAAAEAHDYEMAERLFRSIHSAYPDPLTLGYQLASVQYQAGQFDQCQNTLASLVAAAHPNVEIYNLLALCYHRQGKEKEAIRTLDESLERIPHTAADYITLGNMLLDNSLFWAALITAKRAVDKAPDSEKAYLLKGTAELNLHSYRDAIQTFSRAVELDPSSAQADLGLALAEWQDGQTQEAQATFEAALKRFPRDPGHYTQYARMLLETGWMKGDTGMESRAVSLLHTALSLDPAQSEAHYELGNALLAQKKADEALTELKTAGKLDPHSSKIHYALARAYERLGRNEEAAKEMQEFQKLKEDEKQAAPVT